ncbi:MAG: calcium/sodium antiporter [Patescibacteria group bacterium]|nr:calcium/sodium antiporter [Patescibacteria group bacterium]
MILTYILLPIGFYILIKGASFLVEGASSMAKKFGISSLVIGLTIVAFGTSMPELVINIFASTSGSTDIAIGNILGSNISNILLILGISAIIFPLAVKKGTVWREIPFSLLAMIVMILMVNDTVIDQALFAGLTRVDGFVLLSFFAIFIYYTFSSRKMKSADKEEVPVKKIPTRRAILMIIAGLIGLTLGGKWIVNGSVAIATAIGISEAVIGLTVVAIGTSLPELATSVIAALKKDVDIAVGNIIGSNIFNIFWILGVSASINPLPFSSDLMKDALMAVFATILLFLFLFIGKKHMISRWQGIIFVILYFSYITFLVLQEVLLK